MPGNLVRAVPDKIQIIAGQFVVLHHAVPIESNRCRIRSVHDGEGINPSFDVQTCPACPAETSAGLKDGSLIFPELRRAKTDGQRAAFISAIQEIIPGAVIKGKSIKSVGGGPDHHLRPGCQIMCPNLVFLLPCYRVGWIAIKL